MAGGPVRIDHFVSQVLPEMLGRALGLNFQAELFGQGAIERESLFDDKHLCVWQRSCPGRASGRRDCVRSCPSARMRHPVKSRSSMNPSLRRLVGLVEEQNPTGLPGHLARTPPLALRTI
jgi:hypothetical protein